MMKKNDEFIGKCTAITENGLGVVRNEGFCFFVKNALPEEEVRVHVTAVKKNYGFGFVKEHLSYSSKRVEPKCKVFGKCGGCQLQHLSYQGQLEYKTQRVKDCFTRIAKLEVDVQDCLGMENPWNYRNKVQVPVQYENGQVKAGFYRINTHDIIEYENCDVQSDLQNRIVHFIKEKLIELGCADVFRHVLIKHAHRTNQVMVVFIVSKYPFDRCEELVKSCTDTFEEIKSVIVNINDKEDNVILGNQEVLLYGNERIQEKLEDLYFNISSKSFYQINPYQTQVLYNKAIEMAELSGNELVADVYCGTGTIGIFASRYAKECIGIEIVPSAIEDAKINAKNNHAENIRFICGDAGKCTQELAKEKTKIDVAIVDPPRKGLDDKTIEALVKMEPVKIVYVSCDPATLARDCAIFDQQGYQVKKVQPIDLFPHSTHVENVVLLNRKK